MIGANAAVKSLVNRAKQDFISQQTTLLFMNENEPPPIPPALNQITPNSGMGRNWRIVLAFSIGVSLFSMPFFLACVSFILTGEIGETLLCFCASFIGLGVCFFITQYLLSRGNPQALCKDWPLIIAMNLAPFAFCLVFIVLAFLTKRSGGVMLVVTMTTILLVCSYAGAALATLIARRRLPVVPPALG